MKKLLVLLTVIFLSACMDQAKIENKTEDLTLIVAGTDGSAITDEVEKEPEREIAWTVGPASDYCESIYMDDPGVLMNLFEVDRNAIVRVTIVESNRENDAVLLPELLEANSFTPITPMKIKINEVILGEFDPLIDTIYVGGGTILLQELYLKLPEGTVDKMGLNKLSEEERLTQFASYEEDADFTYKTGKEYILVVTTSPGFPNQVYGNGYGTFISSYDFVKGASSFKNAVSGRDFSVQLASLESDFTQGKTDHNESNMEEPSPLKFNLVKSSPEIQISYTDIVAQPTSQAIFGPVSEEELLADSSYGTQIAAFHGTVKAIHHLEVAAPDFLSYWSVAEIEINEDFRTDLEPGTIVTVQLPPNFVQGTGAGSIMDYASLIEVGTHVIMTPYIHNETSTFEMGGYTLFLDELATFGLMDSIYNVFVETPDGIAFAEDAYPSFSHVETLEDVADIIRNY